MKTINLLQYNCGDKTYYYGSQNGISYCFNDRYLKFIADFGMPNSDVSRDFFNCFEKFIGWLQYNGYNVDVSLLSKKVIRKRDLVLVAQKFGFTNCVSIGYRLFLDCDFNPVVLDKFPVTDLVKFDVLYAETCKREKIKKTKDLKEVLKLLRDKNKSVIIRKLKNKFLNQQLKFVASALGYAYKYDVGSDLLDAFSNADLFDNQHGFGLVLATPYSKKYCNLDYYTV